VGVFCLLALGVVLAVDGRPLFGDHASGHPEPEAEEVGSDGVQVQGAVRLVAVQKNGDAGNGDVGEHQGDQDDLPPGRAGQAIAEQVDQAIAQGDQKIDSNH